MEHYYIHWSRKMKQKALIKHTREMDLLDPASMKLVCSNGEKKFMCSNQYKGYTPLG